MCKWVVDVFQGENSINERLLSSINETGELHMVPAIMKARYVIRFCVCAPTATDEDIHHAVGIIQEMATDVLEMDDGVTEIQPTVVCSSEDEEPPQPESDDTFCVVRRSSDRKGSIFVPRTPFARLVSDPDIFFIPSHRRLSVP